MNRRATSSETHVAVARRPGDVPVLHWTKSHRIPSTKSGNNDRSTTFGPASMLHNTHLVPTPAPPWITTGTSDTSRNRSRQIWRTERRPRFRSKGSTSTLCHQLRDVAVKIAAGVGTSPNPNYKTEERDPRRSRDLGALVRRCLSLEGDAKQTHLVRSWAAGDVP
jgi:hypothetical protein